MPLKRFGPGRMIAGCLNCAGRDARLSHRREVEANSGRRRQSSFAIAKTRRGSGQPAAAKLIQNLIRERHALGIVFLQPGFRGVLVGKRPSDDPCRQSPCWCRHRSRPSFHHPFRGMVLPALCLDPVRRSAGAIDAVTTLRHQPPVRAGTHAGIDRAQSRSVRSRRGGSIPAG